MPRASEIIGCGRRATDGPIGGVDHLLCARGGIIPPLPWQRSRSLEAHAGDEGARLAA